MASERFYEIDILRGLGIFFIIIVHSAAYFLSSHPVFLLWNFSQFAVPVFVFCSTYLFFQKRKGYIKTSYSVYVWKRLSRLLLPYYVFLIFYLPLAGFVSFQKIELGGIMRELTLSTPGTEINWAVLLFVYVAALMPFLLFLYRKLKPAFFLYAGFALGVSSLFLFYKSLINFRLIMWIPWSLIVLYSWFFVRFEERGWFYPFTVLGTGGLFAILSMFLNTKGASLVFIDNKYPPNLYFLTYGIFVATALYLVAKKGAFNFVRKPVLFLSKNSYSIFFIHLLLIIAATKFFDVGRFTWGQFFGVLLGTTLIVQAVSSKIKYLRRR